ncbi:hypothetical protein Vretimale_10913 [Volvox reticuliferus]|uniref:LisH domain-containing protein n=1 Tax=Volvox reticuliferus TaxID=1737510 RepID=A0A8J4LRI0_9CHLO|nr:hypothetical protein Vretifemale_12655 [Volvox reticuliferus]GIM06651.1 hypothetical protein Vretimale_10913 [Volvox reticuliferus]
MDIVHKSAHPSLPPAAPVQVVQYLLAKNFHLTALELLVEAQQAGHGDDVRDLEAFFSDPDRFPPEELARYQSDNALDLQATGRERESRLQLAEYELRLAKEDLAEMARKLAQSQGHQQPQPTHTGNGVAAAGAAPAAASSPFSADATPQSPSTGPGAGPGARLSSTPQVSGAVPTPEDQRVLNMAVFAHLLRQGLVTTAMTMEEEFGGPLRPMGRSSVSSVGTATHGSADAEHSWDLWSWYQAATMPQPPPRLSSPCSNAADAAAGGATTQGAEAPVGQIGSSALLSTSVGNAAVAAVVDPDYFIRQYDLGPESLDSDRGPATANRFGDDMALTGNSSTAAVAAVAADINSEIGAEEQDARQLHDLLTALREELAETRARARAAVVAAVGAAGAAAAVQRQQNDQQQQQKQLKPAVQSKQQSTAPKQFSYISSDAAVLDLLDLGSSSGFQTAAGVAAASAAATDVGVSAAAVGKLVDSGAPQLGLDSSSKRSPAAATTTTVATAGIAAGASEQRQVAPEATAEHPTAAAEAAAAAGAETHVTDDASQLPPWLRRRLEPGIDPTYHASLEGLLSGLCDMLPRLVPNLNLKSRVEVLPLLVTAAKTNPDWTARRQLLSAVFNLVPAPDHQQRQAIIDSSLELCRAFGSGWAATELVQLCCRQASSASSERRTLVAEALGEAVGTVDPGTQAHVLLTQLSQLARDRMEQVREAACHSLARLVPRLPFTRSYFATLEGILLPLATDGSEAVHVAALSYLVPALLTWQPQDTEAVLVSSCMARVFSEMGQQVRIIEQYQQHFLHPQMYHPQQQQQQPPKAAAAATAPAGPSAADTSDAAGSGGTAAATASSSGISFAGTFLRYTHAPPPSPPPPVPTPGQQQQAQSSQLPADGQAGGDGIIAATSTKGSTSNLSEVSSGSQSSAQTPPLPPPSAAMPSTPLPPPQWVSFGRRNFPSASHLLLYQLLALFNGLTPALRHAALRTRPAWACPAGFVPGSALKSGFGATVSAGSSAGPQEPVSRSAAAETGGGRRPHKTGSFGSSVAVGAGGDASTAASATNASVKDFSKLLPVTHRRTSSQPVVLGLFGGPPTGGGGNSDGGNGGQSRIPADHHSLQNPSSAPSVQMSLAQSSSSNAFAKDGASGDDGGSAAAAMRSGVSDEAVAAAVPEDGGGSVEGLTERAHSQRSRMEDEALRNSLEVVDDMERAEEDAALALWATHGSHSSWKTLEWLMQHVVPELIRLVCCLGPMFPEAQEVRRQAACAVAAICNALGVPFTQAAVEPVFLVASGTGAHLAPGTGSIHVPGGGGGGGSGSAAANVVVADFDAPLAVGDVCAAVQPRTPETLYMARQCVLPVLLVSVLPSAQQLRPYLLQLMGSAHELRQRWLLDALPDYTAAVTYACSQRPDLVAQVLNVLENLLSGAGSSHAAAISQQKDAGGSDAAVAGAATSIGGPASTHVGLCCAALARALVPVASLEITSRRLLPGLMALMSYGEPELQRACVGVLAELAQRFRDHGPRVSEQVLVVYDSLLEQGSHVVQLDVLAAGTSMAAAAAPSAAVAAAAAAQVEWLLTAVQVVAARLTSSAASTAGTGGAGGAPTLEQQRTLAGQLLSALRAVAPYDLRLPRLQANLNAALDAIQRCKTLLSDPQQQAALTALLKERPTGPSAAGSSISSTTPAVASLGPGGAAAANATPHRMGTTQPLPPSMLPYTSPAPALGLGVTVTPTQATTNGGGLLNSFLPQNGGGAAQPNQVPPDSGAGGQFRSRFDAFRQRLMKRRDDAPPTTQGPTGGGALTGGTKPKESFFSDDEGE